MLLGNHWQYTGRHHRVTTPAKKLGVKYVVSAGIFPMLLATTTSYTTRTGGIDSVRDAETINLELALADLSTVGEQFPVVWWRLIRFQPSQEVAHPSQ